MPNPHRGEIAFDMDGEIHILRLTLGSLAVLEDALGSDGLQALSERLQAGRLGARDICQVLAAGFSGAGRIRSAEQIGAQIAASELTRAAEAAAKLLEMTFGGGSSSRPPPPQAT
ncbi:MAG: gene transfer agent family protein [Beijerinckiaceae bacterium]